MYRKGQHVGSIGIDVGAHHVRVIQFRRRQSTLQVVAAESAALEPGAEQDPDAIQAVLATVLAKHKFIGKCAVTCLPATDVEVKSLRLPCMPEAELEAAVEFEARERFNDVGDDSVIRSIPAGLVGREDSKLQEVIVLVSRKEAIEARLNLLTRLGLTVGAIEPAVNSFFRPFEQYLQRASDARQANAFVDIGQRGSRIIITCGHDIVFLKACAVGGEGFDQLIAHKLSMEPRSVAGFRQRCFGVDAESPKPSDADAVMEAMQPALDQLGKEIGLCLRYYAVTFRGEKPDGITCGGYEAAYPTVLDYLSQVTRMPVQVGHALRGVECGGTFDDAQVATGLPEWTTAVGLALRSMGQATKVAKVA